MWKKVEKKRLGRAKPARTSFAVSRGRSGHQAASLVIPADAVSGPRANIYSDGNGKLAFHMGESGSFAVSITGPKARSRKIAIPSTHAHRIPFGTTEVSMQREGDMWVLDLSALPAA